MFTRGSIQLKTISKHFQVGRLSVHALKSISLEFLPGEFVVIQGPSGSGKSTLLNILGLIEQPSDGELLFGASPTHNMADNALTHLRRDQIGFIFQNFNLTPTLTAQENVEFALYLERRHSVEAIKDRASKILAEVGLERFRHHKPAELSGGQRQRVAIARALVKQPGLVLADEPTANLDSKSAEQIVSLLSEMNRRYQATIIIATHDAYVASHAQRLVHLKDGMIEKDQPAMKSIA